ncbi:MAG: IS4 family transposase [Anaerolineales bacterium]|jgi:hypothetical protein
MRKNGATKQDVRSIAKNLKSLVGENEMEDLARSTGFLRRKRVLVPHALVLALLTTLGMGKADWIADILRSYNALTGASLRYKPFHNQLKKSQFPEWIRQVLETALLKLALEVLEPLPQSKLEMFEDIVMHDGTSFAVKTKLRRVFPGRFKKVSPAAVELHVTMSGFCNSPESITLAPDRESERHFRPDPCSLKGRLALEDRAFQDKKYFLAIDQAGGFFIIRGTKNIKPRILEAYDENGVRLRWLEGKKVTPRRLPRQSLDLKIGWGKDDNEYIGRMVVIYKPGRRNKKEYTYLHSNLSRDAFSLKEVGTLYRLRWQIELLFLEWKSHANLHKFDTGKKAIAEGLIWASILASMFQRYIAHAAELVTKMEISTQRVAKSTLHFLPAIIAALLSLSLSRIISALKATLEFLKVNATRAHPERDRLKGRLQAGLRPIASA